MYIYIYIYTHAHISLQRSVEMLALQCAQRFPARPADPDFSVFAELFPAPQPEPSQPNVPRAKAKQMHLNWNPLGFLSELSQQKSVTRCPPDFWQAFLCRSFGAPIPKMLAPRSQLHALLLQDVHRSFGLSCRHLQAAHKFYSRSQPSHGCGGIPVA